MDDEATVLVVAATARELAVPGDWVTLACGVGPVEAAVATAAAIAAHRPAAVLHVGIAGARASRGLAPGSFVIGSEARYCDLNVPAEWAPSSVSAAPLLLAAIQGVLPAAPVLPIGTSARVGGTTNCDVEAMEGFAVLRAAQNAGVPAIEVRAIANAIEEQDRARWHFDAAFTAITDITPGLVHAVRGSLRRA
jgi:futalosine hydrolase